MKLKPVFSEEMMRFNIPGLALVGECFLQDSTQKRGLVARMSLEINYQVLFVAPPICESTC